MTLVLVDAQHFTNGANGQALGTVTCTPFAPVIDGGHIVTSKPIVEPYRGPVTIDLTVLPDGNAWLVRLVVDEGIYERVVAPVAGPQVNLFDLPNIDLTTLDPEAPLDPAWVAGLEAVQDELDGRLSDQSIDDRIIEGAQQRTGLAPIVWRIVVGIGQSNMDGRGTPYGPTTDPVTDRVAVFAYGGTYVNSIMPAADPLTGQGGTPSGLGPLSGFGRDLASRIPENHRVLLVPAAVGGTAFESGTNRWKVTQTPSNTNLWRRAMDHVARAKAAVTAQGDQYLIDAVLWLQGETDGDNSVSGATYQGDLDELIDATRTELGLPNLPFIVGQMVPDYLDTGTRAAINTVHAATPSRKTKTAFAWGRPGQPQADDGNHYNAIGQRAMSQNMSAAFRRILAGTADPVLPAVPAAGATPTTSSVATTTLTLTSSASARVTVYRWYRKLTSGGSWVSIGSTTSPTLAVTGLTDSTSYDFKVIPINAAGPGAESGIRTTVTAAPTNLLGVTGTGLAAYSLSRRVKSDYAGPLIRVRVASTETDIPIASGVLDASALAAAVGSSDAFLVTVYDQTGNGMHLTNATTTAQPRIATAGTLVTSGGKLAATFDGVDDILWRSSSIGMYVAGAATAALVASVPAVTTAKRMFTESVSSVAGDQYGLLTPDYGSNVGGKVWPLLSGVYTSNTSNAGTRTVLDGTIHQLTSTDTGAAFAQWGDGNVDMASQAYTRSGHTTPKDRFAIGGVKRSGSEANLAMTFSELVVWGSTLGTSDRQTAEANQKAFYGTP